MEDEPRYITRLMLIQCDKGTMSNYINVGQDHGVLAGGNYDGQPVLNANDHTDKNIMSFGNCKSEMHPERGFRETLVKALIDINGTMIMIKDEIIDVMENLGIMAYKCKPNTPTPWTDCNEHCILDGAPALTMHSQLTCRYEGTITFVPIEDYPKATQNQDDNDEDDFTPPPEDVVCNAVAEAVKAAAEEVSKTGEAGEKAVENMQIALAVAAAMSNVESQPTTSQVSSQNDRNDSTFQFDFGMLGNDEIIISPNLMYPMVYDSNATFNNSGAVALYNTVKIVEPNTSLTYAQAVEKLEPYKPLNTELGLLPTGVVPTLNTMGYKIQYCFGQDIKSISKRAAGASAGIVLYATTKNFKYVAFHPDQMEIGANEQTFTFYNEAGLPDDSQTFQSFNDSLSDENCKKLGMVVILVNASDIENLSNE